MDRIAFVRVPSGPLSATVFLHSVHLHFSASHLRPALKQSQYNAIHLLLGQEQPVGLSYNLPISKVAEHNKSNLSNPLAGLFIWCSNGTGDGTRVLSAVHRVFVTTGSGGEATCGGDLGISFLIADFCCGFGESAECVDATTESS